MLWTVTLEGGPFDGDRAKIEAVPESIWVAPCCSKHPDRTYWYSEWAQGAERYAREEVDNEAETAKYVHADIDLGPRVEEEELATA